MSSRRRRRKREGTAGAAAPPAASTEPVGEPAPGPPAGEPTEPAGEEDSGGGLISETRAALAPVKKRHILVASVGLMGFAFAGTLLFAAVSFWWTSQPSFCGRCHVMEPYIAAWEQSAHSDVNCESCHLTPGFFGFIGGKIAGLQVVANYIRGDYEDWSFNAAVSNASCLQCHDEILAKNIHSADTGVIVSHRNIVETGGKCMFCHSTVAHGAAVQMGSATHPTMATCLTCHNDEIAPLDCDLCHVGKRPLPEETASPTGGSG
jgi:cytochrome c nitrite reductase small subunit